MSTGCDLGSRSGPTGTVQFFNASALQQGLAAYRTLQLRQNEGGACALLALQGGGLAVGTTMARVLLFSASAVEGGGEPYQSLHTEDAVLSLVHLEGGGLAAYIYGGLVLWFNASSVQHGGEPYHQIQPLSPGRRSLATSCLPCRVESSPSATHAPYRYTMPR